MSHLKHHQTPPFRAEHLGSLLRPKTLLEKRKDVDDKKLELKDLTPYEDDAVDGIVATQLDLGFRAVSDGEYR
jgi:methionine synthase II (cobalamin-independent)